MTLLTAVVIVNAIAMLAIGVCTIAEGGNYAPDPDVGCGAFILGVGCVLLSVALLVVYARAGVAR